MQSGKIRKKARLERPDLTKDPALGGNFVEYEPVIETKIGIEPMTSQDRFFNQQNAPDAKLVVRWRFHKEIDVQEGWRFIVGNRILKIIGKQNVNERNREWEFLCDENPVPLPGA